MSVAKRTPTCARVAGAIALMIAGFVAPASILAQTTKRPPAAPRKASTPAAVATPVVSPTVAPDSTHPYRPGVDVTHYAFTLRLPQSGTAIEGRAVVEVSRRLSTDTLILDLVGLHVDSVQVGARSRAFARDSVSIRIPLMATDGAALSVTVTYHGEPSDGLIIRETQERGWSAFGDNWPNRARFWLPTVDHPSDKATVAWTVIAPTELAIVANGVRGEHAALPNGYTRTQFSLSQPIPTYLMVIAAAKMVMTSLGTTACGAGEKGACVPQAVWTFPAQQSTMPGTFAEAGKIVAFYSRIGGPFAYPQLSHLQSATRFGGMENATAIFYSDDAFKRNAVGVPLIAHETAHQWFGDAVTPRRWQDVWLSEGFASYWAPLYLRESSGDSLFRVRMNEIRNEILASPVVASRPVVDTVGAATPNTLLNVNSYQKGAWVLHMLRAEVGDSAFFDGIRDYQRAFRNGTATTENLRASLEKRAGASLRPFFEQWLHRPGYAELNVSWSFDAAKRVATFTVQQGDKFPPYGVALVVALRDATGNEERHTLHLDPTSAQSIQVPVFRIGAPTLVVLDPDVQLLAKLTLSSAH